MNTWASIGASREPTFPLSVTCVCTMGRSSIALACPYCLPIFENIHVTLSAIVNPLAPNVNSWDDLEASREPTLFLNMTRLDTTSRLGIPLASPIFCRFFGTIHDPLSALPCPLGPNVNRWRALGAVFVNCVVPVDGLSIPLASPISCGFFEAIHDPLSAILNPLAPNVNSWYTLEASREPTLFLNMTCVGTMSRLGIPLAFPIFWRLFGTIHDHLSAILCLLGPNVNSWSALEASRQPYFYLT